MSSFIGNHHQSGQFQARAMKTTAILGVALALGSLCRAEEQQKLEIKHVGVNRLPDLTHDPDAPFDKFAYSEGPLAYDAQTSEILMIGHHQGQRAIRIKTAPFENSGERDVTKFNTAEISGEWHDPTHG